MSFQGLSEDVDGDGWVTELRGRAFLERCHLVLQNCFSLATPSFTASKFVFNSRIPMFTRLIFG